MANNKFTNIQKKATTNQILYNVAVKKPILQSLSIDTLDKISGGPPPVDCPACKTIN